jgi:putative PEP-CTERM system histidine kinase
LIVRDWLRHDWWSQPQLVAMVSYGWAALAFVALAGYAVRRLATPPAIPLALAALVTAVWAAMVAWVAPWFEIAGAEPQSLWWLEAAETMRTTAWLQLLAYLASDVACRRRWLVGLGLAALLQMAFSVLPWPGAGSQAMLRLATAVAGMLLVEQVYRAAPPGARWGIKLACLGIGALFAYDFYLYADALLFQRVHADMVAARGVVNALSAPLLAAALARKPAWDHRLQLSRQMMFHSVALLGAAGYLLTMAASAWYLRYMGGLWGPVMQVACLCGSGLLLVAVLFSGAVRARLRLWIGKHFYRGRYDYREEWQRFTAGLGAAAGPLRERIIEALAGLVESPAGALWLWQADGCYVPAASWNMPLPGVRPMPGDALCHLMDTRHWVVEPAAWRRHPQHHGDVPLPDWLADSNFWLVTPLLLDGRLSGFIGLAPPRTGLTVDWEVRDVLRIAGRQAATVLAHRQSADSLAVARQFESFNRMSAFVAHDLKNLVSQLGLLLSNAERHRHNPQFQDDMLATSRHALGKMQDLLRKLHAAPAGQPPERAVPLDLGVLLAQAVKDYAAMAPQPLLAATSPGTMVVAQPERLARVLGHLILNAIEATADDGAVTVRLQRQGDKALIDVCDTGHGMSPAFIRDRLFQAFDSTKTAGMGIGVFESREYLHELGGQLDVTSTPGVGTRFAVMLPLVAPQPRPQQNHMSAQPQP